MIIDLKAHPILARHFAVEDAISGRRFTSLAIFYADDVAGIIRFYVKEALGDPGAIPSYFSNAQGDGAAWAEMRHPIRIVLRPKSKSTAEPT